MTLSAHDRLNQIEKLKALGNRLVRPMRALCWMTLVGVHMRPRHRVDRLVLSYEGGTEFQISGNTIKSRASYGIARQKRNGNLRVFAWSLIPLAGLMIVSWIGELLHDFGRPVIAVLEDRKLRIYFQTGERVETEIAF